MVHEQSSGAQHHHPQLPRYGNGGGAATGVARASKKNKPKKIPQRGLGVAQLEKLRIEEQKKMEGAAAHAGGGGSLGHLLSMHPPPPPPSALSLSALPTRPAGDGGGRCGFPPVLWDPADPMRHPYKRSLCPQPPLPTVSTGLSLTASSSHRTEPPSNQMYSSSVSRNIAAAPAPADEDRDAAGMDRSWPFMFEGMNAAAFRTTGKAPFAAARTTREAGLPDVCPDLSRYEFRAPNYFSTNANYSDWASEFAHCKSSKENGCTGEPAYLTLNAQPVPLIKQPHVIPSIHLAEYGDFSVMRSQQASVSASSSSSRPFYSFMPVGPVRCDRPLGEIKTDVSDGVDLELKL
ncbi:unnamed protein product [Urochloa humidicola]